jgi:hypothetical protein
MEVEHKISTSKKIYDQSPASPELSCLITLNAKVDNCNHIFHVKYDKKQLTSFQKTRGKTRNLTSHLFLMHSFTEFFKIHP